MLQKYPDVAQVFYETSKERFVQFKERIEMIENEREQTIRQIRQILQMVPRIKHCNIGFLHVLAMKLATELAAPLQRELENFTIFQKLIIFIGGNVSILGTDKKIVAEIKGAGYFGALFNSSKNSEKYTAVMESNCLICNLTLEGIKKLFPLYPEIEKQLKEDVPLLSVEREPALKKAVSCIGESPSLRSTSGTHEKPLSSLRTYSLDFHTLKKFSRNIILPTNRGSASRYSCIKTVEIHNPFFKFTIIIIYNTINENSNV
ncbi:uncharacterized protein LOC135129346 [Zophobas morio]|uniref:uncharacterized protein LOC135129346 n=1 Tax=Zophobas morio TaxID=2755281 RepID=UPI00308391C2